MPPPTAASKKAKPSFDVARAPLADSRSGWVYRSDAPPLPRSAPPREKPRFEPAEVPQPPTRGWMASGLYWMALPMAVGMTLMLAPVVWILGARSRR